MNAVTHVNDRTSTRNYLAGEMYRRFLASTNLLPTTEGTPMARPWTHSQALSWATGRDTENNSIHF